MTKKRFFVIIYHAYFTIYAKLLGRGLIIKPVASKRAKRHEKALFLKV